MAITSCASRFLIGLGALLMIGLAGAPSVQAGERVFLSDDTIRFEADGSGDIVAFGGDIVLRGESDGSVIAMGESVDIDMFARDDVLAFGNRVSLSGVTDNDLVAIGDQVIVEMTVTNDMAAIGDQVIVEPGATVGSDTSLYGDHIQADGSYAGDFEAGGSSIDLLGNFAGEVLASGDVIILNGYFSGDVEVRAETVEFGDGVQFLGDLIIKSPNPVDVPGSISVSGRTEILEISSAEIHQDIGYPKAMKAFFPLLGIGIAIVVLVLVFVFGGGALIIALTAGISRRGVAMLRDHPGKSFLYGLAVFTVGLIAVIIASAIYSPLGILGLGYAIALLLGMSFAAYAVFTLLVDRGRKPHGGGKRFGFALLATFLLFIIMIVIPILGQILGVAALIFGLGAYFGGMVTTTEEIAA